MMALSPAHIILDTIQAATNADVIVLGQQALQPNLFLRILLTYLPESTDPTSYIPILQSLSTHPGNLSAAPSSTNASSLSRLSNTEARKRVKAVHLLPLEPLPNITAYDGSLPEHLVTFLVARSRRIDVETGSLPLVQELLDPFVERSSYLRLWMASTILPLLRLNYEYYPERNTISLEHFEQLRGASALDTLIGGARNGDALPSSDDCLRDLKRVVSPWMSGEIVRTRASKRRKLSSSVAEGAESTSHNIYAAACWKNVDDWIVQDRLSPKQALEIVTSDDWEGPGDMDDGGWIEDNEEVTRMVWDTAELEQSAGLRQARVDYARAAMATLYLCHDGDMSKLHRIPKKVVSRLRTVGIDYSAMDPPYHLDDAFLQRASNVAQRIQPTHLMEPSNPLTRVDTVNDLERAIALAEHLLGIADMLSHWPVHLSISKALQLMVYGTANEQKTLLQKLLQAIYDNGRSDKECSTLRDHLTDSLRDIMNYPQEESKSLLGKINAMDLEHDILQAFVKAGRHQLTIHTYLHGRPSRISPEQVEEAIYQVAMSAYDNASNGNRTRGGMKKASDILHAFSQYLPKSRSFAQLSAILKATHSLSFYSLTLQHGVPCQPVNIRVHPQPVTLIDKVLAQNPRSYTQLDDLISIGQDFVRAGLIKPSSNSAHTVSSPSSDDPTLWQHSPHYPPPPETPVPLDAQLLSVQRLITARAISAALSEDDFDTAYSYVVNRLSSPGTSSTSSSLQSSPSGEDDILWRAALAAGRYRPRSPASTPSAITPLRRLEQRMELLSQSLQLAPASELEGVLSTWRECEEELNVTLGREEEMEERWDAEGEKRAGLLTGGGDRHVPGGFGGDAYIHNVSIAGGGEVDASSSKRNAASGTEEAPMGLFDVARGAAAALGRNAFPLGAGVRRGGDVSGGGAGDSGHDGYDGQHDGQDGGEGRVRKRDMVSNIVTGGLSSGLGWVLGATPVKGDER